MATRFKTTNPRAGNPSGIVVNRFAGVNNIGAGANLRPSEVDDALDANDRWRGAVKKRDGFVRQDDKNQDILNYGLAFGGFYLQGDGDVYYQVEELANYKIRPTLFDPWWFNWNNIGFQPYQPLDFNLDWAGWGFPAGEFSTGDSTPPAGFSTTVTWRYYNIARALNDRIDEYQIDRATAGLQVLDTSIADAKVTYEDINNARAYVKYLGETAVYKGGNSYYVLPTSEINSDTANTTNPIQPNGNLFLTNGYGDWIDFLGIGGSGVGTDKWTNVDQNDQIYFADEMIATDQIVPTTYVELEQVVRIMKYVSLRRTQGLDTSYTTDPAWGVQTLWNGASGVQPNATAGAFPFQIRGRAGAFTYRWENGDPTASRLFGYHYPDIADATPLEVTPRVYSVWNKSIRGTDSILGTPTTWTDMLFVGVNAEHEYYNVGNSGTITSNDYEMEFPLWQNLDINSWNDGDGSSWYCNSGGTQDIIGVITFNWTNDIYIGSDKRGAL